MTKRYTTKGLRRKQRELNTLFELFYDAEEIFIKNEDCTIVPLCDDVPCS